MKHILSLSPTTSRYDYQFTTDILGRTLRIQRVGTNHDPTALAARLRAAVGTVDALALHACPAGWRVGQVHYPHRAGQQLRAQARPTPLFDGGTFGTLLLRWAVRCVADAHPTLLRRRRVVLTSGLAWQPAAEVLASEEAALRLADPLLHSGLPPAPALRSLHQLARYATLALPLAAGLAPQHQSESYLHPLSDKAAAHLARLCGWADVLLGDSATLLALLHAAPASLRGRTVMTDALARQDIDLLREHGVATLVTLTPPLHAEQPFVTLDVLEAMVATIQETSSPPDTAESLEFITAAGWQPTVQQLNATRARPAFAFMVHPLKLEQVYNAPYMRFGRVLPQRWLEKGLAYVPPVRLTRMRGLRSGTTDATVDGVLLTLGSTPREIMGHSPEFTYRQLVQAARRAERMGARIMGLGAFTSVVGDAGLTVAQRSPIAITTGNALTVAVTLETLRQARHAMGARLTGRALVVGATGSIGAVCARLLAKLTGDVVLVAPRAERLLALQQQIQHETPGARVVAALDANDLLPTVDMVVLTTSALHDRLIDVQRLKPGAVVCDVARPANISRAAAAARPDILVVESGDVALPGAPDIGFNIHLPRGVVYACLAETILLALEERFEHYTLGRQIDPAQVHEIDRLMRKHGFGPGALRSFGRELSAAELAACRRAAENARAIPSGEVALAARERPLA